MILATKAIWATARKDVGINDGDGFYIKNSVSTDNSHITIKSISDSDFTGTSDKKDSYGLYTTSDAKHGNSSITIGDISSSNFTGQSGYTNEGLWNSSKSDDGDSRIEIGNTFIANANSKAALSVGLTDYNFGGSLIIGSITNSVFSGSGPALGFNAGINVKGSSIVLDGFSSASNALLEHMSKQGDSFGNTPKGKFVCINGDCV